MKRTLSLLLLCALLLSLVPAARAQETVTLTSPQWTDSGLSVAVQAGQTAALYAATYENGRMIEVKAVPSVTGDQTVTFPLTPAYTAKVFALDAAGRPLCENLTVENEDAVAFHADNLPVPAMDDTLASAVSLAVSAYSSSALALTRTSQDVTARLEAAAEAAQSSGEDPTAISSYAPMPVQTLPARPDLGGSFPVSVPAGYSSSVQSAATAMNAAAVQSNTTKSSYSQTTKACAVLEAVAEAQMAQAQTQARALPLSLLAAGNQYNDLFWAQAISDLYDSYKGGMKLSQLAKDLGVDARRAYSMLTMAQNILQGHYSNEEGDLNEFWEKTMIATKAGAKVGLFVCATIATGGATAASPAGYVTMGEAAGIVVGGVDAALEVTTAGSKIILGSDHVAVKKFEEQTKPVSDALFLFGLFTFNSASAGEKLAFLGDLNERKNELYDNIKLKYNLDVDQITMDVLTMDPNDPTALRKLLDKYRKNDKTGMEEPTQTFEEVVEDFTELRPVTDEKLEELLDEAGITEDLGDVVKDFETEIDQEIAKDPTPQPDDEDYTPFPKPDKMWSWYDSEGNLQSEGCRDSKGNDIWVRTYDSTTHVLASETVYHGEPGARTRTETLYFHFEDEVAQLGGLQRIHTVETCRETAPDTWARQSYYAYEISGVLVERTVGNRSEIFTGDGKLSLVYYWEQSGSVRTNTTYSYYTGLQSGVDFDPTGHLQYVKVVTKDSSTYPETERTLCWRSWDARTRSDGESGYTYLDHVANEGEWIPY